MTQTLAINIKPFIIEVTPERETEYANLKKAREEAQKLVNDPDLHVKYRLRALEVLTKIIRDMTGILKDVQLDEVERDLEELKADIEREKASRGS